MLDRLPESRIMELRDGLLSGWGHEECRSWLATECGVIVKSGSTLNTFYKRHCAPIIRERRKLAAVKSEIYVKEAGRTDWDAATAECTRLLRGHSAGVNSVAVLADGRVVSGGLDRTLRVWDASAGVCERLLEGHQLWIQTVVPLRNNLVGSGSRDGSIRVWNVEIGVCDRMLEGHNQGVNALLQLQDGSLCSASDDATLRIWELEHTVQARAALQLPSGLQQLLQSLLGFVRTELLMCALRPALLTRLRASSC